MIRVVKPPEFFTPKNRERTIFLAGSIEMGEAWNWQEQFIEKYQKKCPVNRDTVIYNPRRDNWDNTLVQKAKNPYFFQQVTWELGYLQEADIKIFYFCKDTLSPISLYEFGRYYTTDGSCYMCVEDGYKREGNLEVISFVHSIPIYRSIDEIINKIL